MQCVPHAYSISDVNKTNKKLLRLKVLIFLFVTLKVSKNYHFNKKLSISNTIIRIFYFH